MQLLLLVRSDLLRSYVLSIPLPRGCWLVLIERESSLFYSVDDPSFAYSSSKLSLAKSVREPAFIHFRHIFLHIFSTMYASHGVGRACLDEGFSVRVFAFTITVRKLTAFRLH